MTDAELLIELANRVRYPRRTLIVADGLPQYTGSTVDLALRLQARPDMVLRAIVEEWDRFRIVRELH